MKFATQSLQNPRTFLIGLYCVFLSISITGTLIYGSYSCRDEKFDNASNTCLHFMFNSASIFSTLLTGALFYGILTKKSEFLLPWLFVELAVLTVSLLSSYISYMYYIPFKQVDPIFLFSFRVSRLHYAERRGDSLRGSIERANRLFARK